MECEDVFRRLHFNVLIDIRCPPAGSVGLVQHRIRRNGPGDDAILATLLAARIGHGCHTCVARETWKKKEAKLMVWQATLDDL